MKRLFAILTLFALLLFACAPQAEPKVDETAGARNRTEAEGLFGGLDESYYGRFRGQNVSINVYNWGEYIANGDSGSADVNHLFEQATGIRVNYTTFATNEELYAKLKNGGAFYDVIIPSDYMIGRMIKENMLSPLHRDNIPNYKNIMERFQHMDYDSNGTYTVPYTWGLVGIFYDTSIVEEKVDSWTVFWDKRYAGQMLMFSNPRDAFGIAQKVLGQSYNTTSLTDWEDAYSLMQEQKQLRPVYVMDEIFDKLAGGEAAIGPYYNGDARWIMEGNPSMAFAFPKEGTNIFSDAMCIPSGARNQEAAEMYINFMSEPKIALENAQYIGYATPNEAAYALLPKELRENPIFYPDDSVLDQAESYENMPEEINDTMANLWSKLLNTSISPGQGNYAMPVFLFLAVVAIGVIQIRKRTKHRRLLMEQHEK